MKKIATPLLFLSCLAIAGLLLAYSIPPGMMTASRYYNDTITESMKRVSSNALQGLEVAYGLEVQLVAAEPMLQNPTNIDVDDRGRIWVTEAYNYRPAINGNPTHAAGDRIVILEDWNEDGRADTAKVFYQGPELNAPLGIAVLGNRVIVSQSPYVWNFYDDNGDDVADRKEIMFQGIEGEQHDHGVHAFTFGPDGKLYFNFGNSGTTLKDKNGYVVLDQDGDEIGPKKYKQGMVFRCNPDGSQVECLGDNFRNPYEVAVDSYGTLWQSDNDDDGNKGTRINYVMPHGNYGYTDEMTGAGWQSNRANREDSIPFRHWHLNDPGVVPNVLQTGAGSPTGIVVYEGNLLPEAFRHQPIHSDAGPNVVRAYPIARDGAGYKAGIINILKGDRDKWFRPADVCVAPDGSLIVADWYDPGVGGHQAGDQVRGRIYRVTPAGTREYVMPKIDYSTPSGAVKALQNPNLVVRFKAYQSILTYGVKAVPQLNRLWKGSGDPAMRARAFWALLAVDQPKAAKYLEEAMKDGRPAIRMLAIRGALRCGQDAIPYIQVLRKDRDIQVRRECALALHHHPSPEAPAIWAELALQHDGTDRWYLEALGIGADAQWDAYFTNYLQKVKDPIQTKAGRDIVWRARTDEAVPYLTLLAANPDIELNARLRYFRAFDFNEGTAKQTALIKLIESNRGEDVQVNQLALYALPEQPVRMSPVAIKALEKVLQATTGTRAYLDLVQRFNWHPENSRLLEMAIAQSANDLGRTAVRTLFQFKAEELIWHVLEASDTVRSKAILLAAGGAGTKNAVNLVQSVVFSSQFPMQMRKYAATRLGRSGEGEQRVLQLLRSHAVPEELIPDVVNSLSSSWMKSVRAEAQSFLPKKQDQVEPVSAPIPTLAALAGFKGEAANGKLVFANQCAVCHKVNNDGYDFGPKLAEIGSKYDKDGLLKAIVQPNEGISFGFEGWNINMKDGSILSGVIASKTETDIDLKFPGGAVQRIKTAQVATMTQMKQSMMPEGLHEGVSQQELSDLLAYLMNLKKKG
jgi:putative membrane-bound dehydrogenase-like protein